ncbi:hypothetical protein AWB68_07479 [Caballeronia choica]|uniref:Uncharacterized protein n=1 Tax=Caballeronia choica TaxID=326476 RepID=A0A158KVZ7_9BURK|nr:hypothetical protein AWB68_07479 [Caballeronia choica]
MRCTIVLEFDNGDGSVVKRVEVMRLHRATENQTPGDQTGACQTVQRVRADRWPGFEGVFDCCATCAIA